MRMFGVLLLFLFVPHVYAQACVPGYTGPDGGPCTPCGSGFYKTTVGTAFCTACSGVTWSNCTACTARTSCLCNAGYTGPDGGDCDQCDSGKYKSQTGSATCTSCDAGKYTVAFAAITCALCPAGTYRTSTGGININACTSCTYAKYLPTAGSTAEAACIPCSLGYQGVLQAQSSVASCTLCVAGKYRDSFASPECTRCPPGKYSAIIGSTSLQACVDCPAGTYSYIASSTCILCPAGTYSVQVAATTLMTCLYCDTNPDQTIKGSSTCFDPNCAAGLTGPYGGPCTACIGGKYKTTTGSDACNSCNIGKYNPTVGATSSAACKTCPTYSDAVIASTACKCNQGYTGPGVNTSCVACVPGKYKDTKGSAICTDCPAGKYHNQMAVWYVDDCWDCYTNTQGLTPAGSSTAEGCICNAGSYYTADMYGGYCPDCEAGYYKDTIGNQVCTKCPNASYANAFSGATACIACPAYSVCKDIVYPVYKCNQLGSCTCDTGYYGNPTDGVACTPCPVNTGSVCTVASKCGVIGHCLSNNGYYGYGESAGTACPSNAGSNCFQPTMETNTMCFGQAECLCNAGYTGPAGGPCIDPNPPAALCDAGYTGPDGGPCSPCAAGTYKSASGSDPCTDCPPGTYSDTAATTACMTSTTPMPSTTSTTAVVSTTTIPIPSTTPQPTPYVVKMAVSLPLTRQEFNSSAQITFKQSVARAAGVSGTDVSIDRILDMNDGGIVLRRLLTSSIRVDTSVQAPNEIAASAIMTSLTADSLNAALVSAGLPAATILEAPTFASDRQMTTTPLPTPVVIVAPKSEPDSNLAAIIGGAVGGVVLCVCVLCFCIFCLRF